MTAMDAVALIDTGATASGIDIAIASRLGLRPVGKRPLQSAHGLGHVDYYMFRVAVRPDDSSVTDFPYVFAECYGFGLTGSNHFNALIGMDILKQCDLALNRSGECFLDLP